METQFTKGPWKAGNLNIVSGESHPVCSVDIGDWGDSYPAMRLQPGTGSLERKYEAYTEHIVYGIIPVNEGKANAALISAAPDMFKFIEEVIASGPNSGYIHKRALELIAQATTFI